jgi:hypothetical protein
VRNEALHDMSRPVDALRATRSLLAEAGWVLVADELVGEAFAVPAGDRERYIYGWSVVSYLPDAMGDPRTAATGAVMRPGTLRGYALEAGFRDVDVLPSRPITGVSTGWSRRWHRQSNVGCGPRQRVIWRLAGPSQGSGT